MSRTYGTDQGGRSFSNPMVVSVWNGGQIVQGVDPNVRRKDVCGAWIDWSLYGDTTENSHGWEIDHIRPEASGGSDDLTNLQPLQWQNNRHKGDNWPNWNCLKAAEIM